MEKRFLLALMFLVGGPVWAQVQPATAELSPDTDFTGDVAPMPSYTPLAAQKPATPLPVLPPMLGAPTPSAALPVLPNLANAVPAGPVPLPTPSSAVNTAPSANSNSLKPPQETGIESARLTAAANLNPTSASQDEVTMTPIAASPAPNVPTSDLRTVPLSEGAVFCYDWTCQAVDSSADWAARWNAPDFGRVHVSSALQDLPLGEGIDLPWQKDASGVPELILTAVLHFPKIPIEEPSAIEQETTGSPLSSVVPVTIKQYVTFYRPAGASWFASASPYYVLLGDGSQAKVILPVSAGKGGWNVRLGKGGFLVRHFVEGGMDAARREILESFRDDEIRLFLQGHADVIFYLRPKHF